MRSLLTLVVVLGVACSSNDESAAKTATSSTILQPPATSSVPVTTLSAIAAASALATEACKTWSAATPAYQSDGFANPEAYFAEQRRLGIDAFLNQYDRPRLVTARDLMARAANVNYERWKKLYGSYSVLARDFGRSLPANDPTQQAIGTAIQDNADECRVVLASPH